MNIFQHAIKKKIIVTRKWIIYLWYQLFLLLLHALNLLRILNLREISKININNNQNKWKYMLDKNNEAYCLILRNEIIENVEYYANDFINNTLWWDELGQDKHFKFRTRCYSRLEIDNQHNELKKLPMKVFSIPKGENALLQDKGRIFKPFDEKFLNHKFIQILIWRVFDSLPLTRKDKLNNIYHVGLHGIRISSIHNQMDGLPTPEGIHQDGAQYVAVIFINRNNVKKDTGKNGIYNLNAINGATDKLNKEQHQHNEQCKKFDYILSNTFDTLLLNDRYVKHDATPILPDDIHYPAVRDMLILTFMTKQEDEQTSYS